MKLRGKSQLEKGKKKTWVNPPNTWSKSWDYDNSIKNNLKKIIKFNPQ